MNVAPERVTVRHASESDRLNRSCFCFTLDRAALFAALDREAGDPEFCAAAMKTRPHLFSNTPVFLPGSAIAAMGKVVAAIHATSRLADYRAAAFSWAPEIAHRDFGPAGVFMGFDFHLGDDGPRLIEVNTNAGGAFLNALLAQAQTACCSAIEPGLANMIQRDAFEAEVLRMFRNEWRRQRADDPIGRVAIIDDQPESQYLYPEFVLARQLFSRNGIDAAIGHAGDLRYENGRLMLDGLHVGLVYNRLVDFSFDRPEHGALRAAYQDGAVVVTPNPFNHALLADKRNLTLLSDPVALKSWGAAPELRAALSGVPHTISVTPDNADLLWPRRKDLFFKPVAGHGGKAVYRGDKVTRTVWAEIARGEYVAQAFAAPGERLIELDGATHARKVDVRLYAYDGRVLLAAARVYQGQTTNFRTPGGGFAPVLVI
ncbi:MAG: hypothetical protein KIS68_16845 [Bauldia sp.]|nr:hypothetical protein [Bauldia sp.]